MGSFLNVPVTTDEKTSNLPVARAFAVHINYKTRPVLVRVLASFSVSRSEWLSQPGKVCFSHEYRELNR